MLDVLWEEEANSLPSLPLAVVGVLRKSSKLNGPSDVEVFMVE
jgi:hypothetical protein